MKVTLTADNITLKEALDRICGDLGLAYVFENRHIFISTKKKVEDGRETRRIVLVGIEIIVVPIPHASDRADRQQQQSDRHRKRAATRTNRGVLAGKPVQPAGGSHGFPPCVAGEHRRKTGTGTSEAKRRRACHRFSGSRGMIHFFASGISVRHSLTVAARIASR